MDEKISKEEQNRRRCNATKYESASSAYYGPSLWQIILCMVQIDFYIKINLDTIILVQVQIDFYIKINLDHPKNDYFQINGTIGCDENIIILWMVQIDFYVKINLDLRNLPQVQIDFYIK